MKFRFTVGLGACVLLCTVLGAHAQEPPDSRRVPQNVAQAFQRAGIPVLRQKGPAPNFTLNTPENTGISLASLRGRVVFLNFWATWCGPCRTEMPSMEALYGRLKGRDFEILAVDAQERPSEVTAFLRQYRLSFPSVLDSAGRVSRLYNITALPTTFILDREGNIILRLVGSINWDTPEILAALETLLAS